MQCDIRSISTRVETGSVPDPDEPTDPDSKTQI